MTTARVHGRYATRQQEREHKRKFEEIHAALRGELAEEAREQKPRSIVRAIADWLERVSA